MEESLSFGGIGLGGTKVYHRHWGFGSNMTYSDILFAFSTRVGAEFFHHFRLTVDSKLMGKDYLFIGVTAGFVLGGGLKR